MGARSTIEWTGASWNPIRARNGETGAVGWFCEHVTSECIHCYAETFNRRLGTGIDFRRQNRDLVGLFLDPEMLAAPLRWRRPRMIFVNSMTDTFGPFVPEAWIDAMFGIMALAPAHTFQVLTKRTARMCAYLNGENPLWRFHRAMAADRDLSARIGSIRRHDDLPLTVYNAYLERPWPLPNVWIGGSAGSQERANDAVPDVLASAAAVRFLSCEPLLGPIDLRSVALGERHQLDALTGGQARQSRRGTIDQCLADHGFPILDRRFSHGTGIDWVIAGGESGPGARPPRPDWFRSLRDQCADVGTAFFFKQWGEWAPGAATPRGVAMKRVGKQAAGKTLDGREHVEFPK